MRFSRTAWLILGIGILVIALGSLYMLYLQQGREQEQLNEALFAAQSAVPRLASERANLESTLTELEDNLAQATSELETAQAVFPTSTESIEVDELLFGIADDWGLDVTNLTASEPSDEKVNVEAEEDIEVEDVTYLVTSFTVEVKGEVADILKFIDTIVTHSDLTTATIEQANINVPEPLTEEEKEALTEEEIEEKETPSATINIIIYAYKGE
jgi:hypothetical protein